MPKWLHLHEVSLALPFGVFLPWPLHSMHSSLRPSTLQKNAQTSPPLWHPCGLFSEPQMLFHTAFPPAVPADRLSCERLSEFYATLFSCSSFSRETLFPKDESISNCHIHQKPKYVTCTSDGFFYLGDSKTSSGVTSQHRPCFHYSCRLQVAFQFLPPLRFSCVKKFFLRARLEGSWLLTCWFFSCLSM